MYVNSGKIIIKNLLKFIPDTWVEIDGCGDFITSNIIKASRCYRGAINYIITQYCHAFLIFVTSILFLSAPDMMYTALGPVQPHQQRQRLLLRHVPARTPLHLGSHGTAD